MKLKNLKLSGMMVGGIIIIVTFAYAVNIQPVVYGNSSLFYTDGVLNTFGSYEELSDFLSKNSWCSYWWEGEYSPKSLGKTNTIMIDTTADSSNGGDIVDYSKTNIQVQGVDEPDVVKTDGRYLYILANSKIYILQAFPAKEAILLSNISFVSDIHIVNFFLNKDRLIVFGTSNRFPIYYEEHKGEYGCPPYWWGISTTVINIFDISNRENPELVKDIEVDGSYFNARMIDDYIYIIATEYTGSIYWNLDQNVTLNIPEITIDDHTTTIPADNIFYVNTTERIDMMTHVFSIDIYSGELDSKSFLLGSSQSMYVSKNNIYLACYQYGESTVIHKISIDKGKISYIAKGEVPGHILNQFSMDEYNGFFRIATQAWNHEYGSTTNLYILDNTMNIISKIENIAPGERMHSSRFIGDKAYFVTFKKVDPFFTLDLSDPYNPKILGELKIPGYSDYLHPYDENHIIGIGKDTVEPQEDWNGRDFAWYQGLKIALFDVSDFDNPKEVAKIIIGDRGTETPVLFDHKAFLFDREKELLVLPVSLHEISDEIKEQNEGYTGNIFGQFTFQGAFVYKLSLENGFEFRGRITHMDDEQPYDNYYWYGGSYSSYVSRSLYIDDVLYTISNNLVKMNNLGGLGEMNIVHLE